VRVAEIARGWTEAARGGAANVIKASLPVPKPVAPFGPRVALLIGNTNYTVAEKLKNPKNDVIAV
jgi:hypothetical protein